jgi:DNA-binding LytR/AlgR family response regulator
VCFAVVDDEPGVLKQIPVLIRRILSDQHIETDIFENSSDFLGIYSHKKYDALFLDIDMPDMNGFDLVDHLRKKNDLVPVVYITARDDLMFQAFRYKVLGFVRKQFIENELPYALSTIISVLRTEDDMIEVTEIRSKGGHMHQLSVKEIMYLKNDRHNVDIHLTDGKIITVRSSISYFTEHEKFQHFIAISNGILVNLSLIELTEDAVCFPNGEKLFIARRKLASVRIAYLNNMEKVLI